MAELNLIGTLSNELIQLIFQCVVDTSSWEESRNTFYTCQLVCKSWSRLAQIALYRDVCLPLHKIESFVKALDDSSTTTQLGDLVHSINFHSGFSYYEKISDPRFIFPYINEMLHGQLIDTVLKCTPHIKRVGSSASPDFEKILWKRLLETKEPLEHLQKFTLLDEPMAATTDLYKQLSLKFKKTLTVLQPVPRAVDSDFTTLKKNLKEFVSLEELQFCGRFIQSPIITEVDDLINNCPTTIHSLTLQECRFLNGHKYPEEIKVNNSITELHLKYPTLSACSLGYFAKKLPGLKKLTVTWADYDFNKPVTQQQHEEWWNQMRQLCQPLQHYNISIRDIKKVKSLDQSLDQSLHQIKGCAGLMVNDPTEITMYLGDLKTVEQNWNIEMKKSDSIVHLSDSQLGMAFEQNKPYFREIFEVIQSFSPQTITLFDVNGRSLDSELISDANSGV